MPNIDAYLEEGKAWADRVLDRTLPAETEWPEALHRAMRYSVMAGGKRFRPILCRACAEAVGGSSRDAEIPAAAIEMLHTYTLIHDDLPAMDNDDLRRGRPTAHKAFGEANAILAGDALLTLSFELLAACPAPPPHPPCGMIHELARAAGSRALAGGQFEDLAAEGGEPDAERLQRIHLNKTARLIEASCRIGGIAAGAPNRMVDRLGVYGLHLGLAFQAADDVLNATSSADALGKAAGSDLARGKLTTVSMHGVEGARREACRLVEQAMREISALGDSAVRLHELARFTVSRAS